MPFRQIMNLAKAIAAPWATPVGTRPEYAENENTPLTTDRRGVLWVRVSGTPGFSSEGDALAGSTPGAPYLSYDVTTTGLTLSEDAPARLLYARIVAGDPAQAFTANPIYAQFHRNLPVNAAVPEYSFPVPPPPSMLSVDFPFPDAAIVEGVGFTPGLWFAFSSTFATYTAGPSGSAIIGFTPVT